MEAAMSKHPVIALCLSSVFAVAGEVAAGPQTFSVDTSPPEVKLEVVGCPGRVMKNQNPTFKCSLKDAGSGVDPASIQVVLDETEDVTALVEPSAGGFTWEVPEALTLCAGLHQISVSLSDVANNDASGALVIVVELLEPRQLINKLHSLGWFGGVPRDFPWHLWQIVSDTLWDGNTMVVRRLMLKSTGRPIPCDFVVNRIEALIPTRVAGRRALRAKGYIVAKYERRDPVAAVVFVPWGWTVQDFAEKLLAEPEVESITAEGVFTDDLLRTEPNDPRFKERNR